MNKLDIRERSWFWMSRSANESTRNLTLHPEVTEATNLGENHRRNLNIHCEDSRNDTCNASDSRTESLHLSTGADNRALSASDSLTLDSGATMTQESANKISFIAKRGSSEDAFRIATGSGKCVDKLGAI